MEHFLHPRHTGSLVDPCGEAWSGSQESNRFMRIQVRLEDQTIADTRFGTFGCAPAIAAGSCLTEWVCGKPIAEALQVTAHDLDRMLGGLPPARAYCADLAVDALRGAIEDAVCRKRADHP